MELIFFGVQRPAAKADSLAECRGTVQLIFFTVFSLSSLKGKIGNKESFGYRRNALGCREKPQCLSFV